MNDMTNELSVEEEIHAQMKVYGMLIEENPDLIEMSDKEKLAFLEWAEKTHPRYLNNLKDGYRRYKEASQ